MKAFMKDFVLRGLCAAWGGPLVLAMIYAILFATGAEATVSLGQAALGIFSITLLAFFIAGMTAIYQLEQLPLISAIMIHGAVLYGLYILIYLMNGWLQSQLVPILIFTAAFVAGYAIIWLCIYLFTKKKTDRINQHLQNKKL